MSSFFERFFSKPPVTRRTLERARDGYSTVDAAVGTVQKVNKLEESLKANSIEMQEMKRASAQDTLKTQAAMETMVQRFKAMEEDLLQLKKQVVKTEEKKTGKK